jgi:phosphoribosyl-dephospho-CoA transferase
VPAVERYGPQTPGAASGGWLKRHQWVWLDRDWRDHLAPGLTSSDLSALTDWLARDRPLVVARQSVADGAEWVRLGLSLPGRRRIGVLVSQHAIVRQQDPPDLIDLAETLPPDWRETVTSLLDLPCPVAVFGSAVWRHFAADPRYLTSESDLDLLLRPTDWRQAESALGHLAGMAAERPRLDGEMMLPDGAAFAWREWALTSTPDLLVKFIDGVALRGRDAIRGQFAP